MKSLPLLLGILAIGTAIPAWIPMSADQAVEADLVGKVLNRTGKEVTAEQVTSVRVVTWDDATSAAKVLEVRRSQGSWLIPSHYNYPADGGTRVGKTSGGVRNVVRGRLATRDSKQHEDLGVVDPFLEDDKVKGRGLRDTPRGRRRCSHCTVACTRRRPRLNYRRRGNCRRRRVRCRDPHILARAGKSPCRPRSRSSTRR